MPIQGRGRIILIVLTIGLVISTLIATKAEHDKRQLGDSYTRAQAMLAELQQERESLTRELNQARQVVESQAADLSVLQNELSGLQVRLNDAEQEITRLQTEHLQLEASNTTLRDRLELTTEEKQALEARLSSIKELKSAIRTVKRKLRQERWESWMAHIQYRREEDQRELARGNRGFVVRDGTPTIGSASKLQVRVLEPQAQ